ncbi:MAG TPA: hypothetical protein VNX25_00855 [Verrucomicrobiae bacterium]|nr:hypothetical protein [Verrucomicrobiae bacterium]
MRKLVLAGIAVLALAFAGEANADGRRHGRRFDFDFTKDVVSADVGSFLPKVPGLPGGDVMGFPKIGTFDVDHKFDVNKAVAAADVLKDLKD